MQKLELKQELINKIEKILTFRFLTKEEMRQLLNVSEIEKYDPDEKIISQGDKQHCIYAIVDGSVKVTVQERNEKEAYICTIGSGEVFGEAGIFTEVRRTANVICLNETILFKISRSSLISFIKQHPKTGNKILMLIIYSLLKKLREVNQELAYERKSDADQEDIDSIIRNFMD